MLGKRNAWEHSAEVRVTEGDLRCFIAAAAVFGFAWPSSSFAVVQCPMARAIYETRDGDKFRLEFWPEKTRDCSGPFCFHALLSRPDGLIIGRLDLEEGTTRQDQYWSLTPLPQSDSKFKIEGEPVLLNAGMQISTLPTNASQAVSTIVLPNLYAKLWANPNFNTQRWMVSVTSWNLADCRPAPISAVQESKGVEEAASEPTQEPETDCKNIVFATKDNEVVVIFHNQDKKTQFTEIKNGVGQICDAVFSFGMSGYTAWCPSDPKSKWSIRTVDEDGSVEYGSLLLERQCANASP